MCISNILASTLMFVPLLFFSVASVKKENLREGNLTVIMYRGGGRTTLTSSHLMCTVYSGQDLMLMRHGSQLYISRCGGKFSPLRCKNPITPSNTLSLTFVCVPSVRTHLFICFCTEYMHVCACLIVCLCFVVVACRIVSAGSLSMCVFMCVQVSSITGLPP